MPEKKFKIVYELVKSDPQVPSQDIKWSVRKDYDLTCKVKFTHFYYGNVREDLLKSSRA